MAGFNELTLCLVVMCAMTSPLFAIANNAVENTCTFDDTSAEICSACSVLPYGLSESYNECCNDVTAQMACAACLIDEEKCIDGYVQFLEKAVENLHEPEMFEIDEDRRKRYGKLFIGRLPTYPGGKRNINPFLKNIPEENTYFVNEKRYGTLGIGKRYGTLNIGKRYGTLNIGKRYGTLNIGKRYGTLSIGKRYGTLNLGKRSRSEDIDEIDLPSKRYGTLFMPKRYGTMFMSNRRYHGK